MKQITNSTATTANATSSFAALLAGLTINNPNVGEIVEGEIMAATRGGFIVDIHTKSDAFLAADEAGELKVGDRARFLVLESSESDEEFTVSHSRVAAAEQRNSAWEKIGSLAKTQATTSAHVTTLNHKRTTDSFAGAEATVDGIKCFIPRRELVYFGNPKTLVGTDIPVKVTSCDRSDARKGTVILSHARAVREQQQQFIATLKVGAVVKGKVTRILTEEKGALIDLGGTTGLLPRCELAQHRAPRTADLIKVGDELDLAVTRTDESKGTVHLSRVSALLKSIKLGEIVRGAVTNITNYGVFVSLQGAVDGLLHDSELEGRNKSEFVAGAEILVRVKGVDTKLRRVALTLSGVPKQS